MSELSTIYYLKKKKLLIFNSESVQKNLQGHIEVIHTTTQKGYTTDYLSSCMAFRLISGLNPRAGNTCVPPAASAAMLNKMT